MGYDPNEWTREFVTANPDFCIRKLKETNEQIIEWLKQGEHKIAVAGLDRVLNGLITMTNAGYDYRSHICFLSWMEANIILFGDFSDAPEHNRIKTAKSALLDARDFAKSDTAKNSINLILDDINKGYGISVLTSKYASDFPNSEIETIADLNNRFENRVTQAAPVRASGATGAAGEKKKPRWFAVAVIAILVFIAISRVLTTEKASEAPAYIDNAPITQTTAQTTESETTTDPTEAVQAEASSIIGSWEYYEISEGTYNPDGEKLPDIRNETYYTFYEDGRFSVGDACYEEANEESLAYAEEKDGRYWICIGGGGQSGNYTISGNQITLITDDSVQYGPSTTSTITFTFDGDTLIIENSYGARAYKLSDFTPNEY